MPRRLRAGEAKGPKNSLVKLAKKVNKNTRILASREKGRLRVALDATPSTTAVVQRVSSVAQGLDDDDRIGNKIHATHVSIRGTIVKAGASVSTGVRFMLLRDNLGSTVPPTLSDIFVDEDDFFENKHRRDGEQEMKRFTILWDKFIILNENFDGQATLASYKFSKKLNFDIIYTGTAATNEGKNGLYFMSASDEATNTPGVTGDIMFRYSDL